VTKKSKTGGTITNDIHDGAAWVNIYSRGKTKLGRMLSNFSNYPVDTIDGTFQSVEGYWYWLSCGDDRLKTASGYEAKKIGREAGAVDYPKDSKFKLKIALALISKLAKHEEIYEAFKQNNLPFDHYYVYGDKVIRPKEGRWILDIWTFIKENLV